MSYTECKLLPCPCGGTPKFDIVPLPYKHRVVCPDCNAISGYGTCFENDKWNAKQWNKLVGGER